MQMANGARPVKTNPNWCPLMLHHSSCYTVAHDSPGRLDLGLLIS
jgi:hypothetical protein